MRKVVPFPACLGDAQLSGRARESPPPAHITPRKRRLHSRARPFAGRPGIVWPWVVGACGAGRPAAFSAAASWREKAWQAPIVPRGARNRGRHGQAWKMDWKNDGPSAKPMPRCGGGGCRQNRSAGSRGPQENLLVGPRFSVHPQPVNGLARCRCCVLVPRAGPRPNKIRFDLKAGPCPASVRTRWRAPVNGGVARPRSISPVITSEAAILLRFAQNPVHHRVAKPGPQWPNSRSLLIASVCRRSCNFGAASLQPATFEIAKCETFVGVQRKDHT